MTYTVEQLPKVWDTFSQMLYNDIPTDCNDLQVALKDTYAVFQTYKDEKNVPRELCEIVYNMYHYTLDLENAVDLPTIDYATAIGNVIGAVLDGFLEKNYACDYPNLKISKYVKKECITNLETEDLYTVLEQLSQQAVIKFD